MLNHYQVNVIDFFDANASLFIGHLAKPKTSNTILFIPDLLQESISFLDNRLKTEINIYERWRRRHTQLIDMLIEVHIINIPSDFSDSLKIKAQRAFVK